MSHHEGIDTSAGDAQRAPTKRRRWLGILLAFVCGVILFLAFLPQVVTATGLAAWLLRTGLARQEIEASFGGASIGWTSPPQIRHLKFVDQHDRWSLTADQASAQLTLWELVTSRGQLGEFVIDRPTIQLNLAVNWQDFAKPLPPEPEVPGEPISAEIQVRVTVRDGRVLIKTAADQTATFAEAIDVSAALEPSAAGPVLTIASGEPLRRARLTPEMCDLGLKFVAPILADAAWTDGEISVGIDHCRIPLDHPETTQFAGRLSIHSVKTGAKNPLVREIVAMAATVVQSDVPESVQLADDSVVDFRMSDGVVHHQGLEFGFPGVSRDLVVRTEGDVAIGGALDLTAEFPVPLHLISQRPLAQAFRDKKIVLPIRGTLDEPRVEFQGDGKLVRELLSDLTTPDESGAAPIDDVISRLLDLGQEVRQRRSERAATGEERPRLFPRRDSAGDDRTDSAADDDQRSDRPRLFPGLGGDEDRPRLFPGRGERDRPGLLGRRRNRE